MVECAAFFHPTPASGGPLLAEHIGLGHPLRTLIEELAMAVTFTPLNPVFAAACSDVDIAQPLTPEDAAAIDEGMDRYAVLVFRREAPLTADQQVAFTKNFGELEPPYTQIQSPEGKRLDNPALADISNLGPGDRITASGCSASATSCGTATAATRPSRRAIRCCAPTWSRRKEATPNSPTCAPPTTRSTRRPRR
jgi:hypothetical protein